MIAQSGDNIVVCEPATNEVLRVLKFFLKPLLPIRMKVGIVGNATNRSQQNVYFQAVQYADIINSGLVIEAVYSGKEHGGGFIVLHFILTEGVGEIALSGCVDV
jgi:hypothetical protein